MSNLNNFNFNKLDLRLSTSDYWDFYLANDSFSTGSGDGNGGDSEECNVVHYDFNNPKTYAQSAFTATSIYSLTTWSKAVNTGYTLNTIGLTGIDNGLITFDTVSGDTANEVLLSAITGTTLVIPSGDTRFQMTRVTGTTNDTFQYDLRSVDGGTRYAQFCGGFYQGFYKLDGYSYEVLPVRTNKAWSAEFWIMPQDICDITGTTLNDIYPNNKGFFFYMGTRAENKYWKEWNGANTGCTSDCTAPTGCTDTLTEWCTIPKESNMSIIGDYGVVIPLSPPQVIIEKVTNPFLIYGRATPNPYPLLTGETGTFIDDEELANANAKLNKPSCSSCGLVHEGYCSKTVCGYNGEGMIVVKTRERITNTTNPFLIYGRANDNSSCKCDDESDGYGRDTICSFTGRTSNNTEIDYNLDIIDNALGFRIKDDGSVGYRALTVTGQCITASTGVVSYITGTSIEEKYSEAGLIPTDIWSYLVIKYTTEYKTDCELKTAKRRKGRLSFYINGKLRYFIDEFDEFIARRLDEYKDKQLAVPFNFSLGGGTLGLLESQTFDGLDYNDRELPLEQNFAGTFIGGIKEFKFNLCDTTFNDMQTNYSSGLDNLNNTVTKAPSGYYYGKFTGATINTNEIINLTFTLSNNIINNSVTYPAINNSYCYVLVPDYFNQPSEFRNSNQGCQGFVIPMNNLGSIVIPDTNGYDVTYIIYRSFNRTSGVLDMWFCF